LEKRQDARGVRGSGGKNVVTGRFAFAIEPSGWANPRPAVIVNTVQVIIIALLL